KNEDKNSIVRAYGFDEQTQSIFIEFNTNISNQNLGIIKEREITLNGEKIKAKSKFDSFSRLYIFAPLKANQNYDIFIDLNDIAINEKL
ncbi:hypothetical protein, partial [Campylobacter volucris]